jgi:hypothetical protein
MAFWNIVRPLGICYAHSVYFFQFWYVVPSEIWQPFMILDFQPFQSGCDLRRLAIYHSLASGEAAFYNCVLLQKHKGTGRSVAET